MGGRRKYRSLGVAPAAVARNHGSGRPRAHRPTLLRGSADRSAGRGPDERRRKLPGSGRGESSLSGHGRTVPRTEIATCEAPRGAPASVIGRRSLAIQGSARPRGGPPGAAFRAQRLSALRFPSCCVRGERLDKPRAQKRAARTMELGLNANVEVGTGALACASCEATIQFGQMYARAR